MDILKTDLPVFGICGWSGSGKTTLIERLVPRLQERGLKTAVAKHDVHGLNLSGEEKDSSRCFRSGADVLLIGPGQNIFWTRKTKDLLKILSRLAPQYDLILVEGFKSLPLPRKVWLGDACPAEAAPVTRVLGPDEDRLEIVMEMVTDWLNHLAVSARVCAGILFGGASKRMGEPKHLIRRCGVTWLELIAQALKTVTDETVLLGGGEVPESLRSVPILPDVQDKEGPLAGILAAMRWRPLTSWVFAACDLPDISVQAVQWLLSMRRPGVWAIMPRLPGSEGVEPLLAFYDYRAWPLLEECAAPSEIARLPQVSLPVPPSEIAGAWRNVNAPGDRGSL
jgi:molybdopterin-guanine dinucleotide biosynthesis protein MobB